MCCVKLMLKIRTNSIHSFEFYNSCYFSIQNKICFWCVIIFLKKLFIYCCTKRSSRRTLKVSLIYITQSHIFQFSVLFLWPIWNLSLLIRDRPCDHFILIFEIFIILIWFFEWFLFLRKFQLFLFVLLAVSTIQFLYLCLLYTLS